MSKEENSEEVPQEGAAGGETSKKDADIYKTPGSKKLIRLITVMAYMFSVSFVAIVLSAYYLFLWEPPNPRLIRRPVQLSSEPEMQFLLSDEMIVENEPDESSKDSNSSYISFSSRVADTENLANNYNSIKKHREKLDESLFLLRNSLVEFLQNRINDSKSSDRNSSRRNWTTSKFPNYSSFEKENTLKSDDRDTRYSSKIMNRMFGNNGTSQILESSTISGDETNNDRFTSTRNYSVHESPQNMFPLNRNLSKNMTINQEKYKKSVSSSFETNVEMFNKRNLKIKLPRYFEVHASSGGFINSTRATITISDEENLDVHNAREDGAYKIDNIKQSIDLNEQSITESARNLELKHSEQISKQSSAKLANVALKFKGDERKDKLYEPKHKQKLVRVLTVVAYVIFVSMAAILLSLYYTFLWDPKDVSVRMRVKPECDNTKLSNFLTTPSTINETQIEKITTKPMTMVNEQSPTSETITTQRQRDMLTILTEIADTSSSTSPLTTFENLQTNSSIEAKEMAKTSTK